MTSGAHLQTTLGLTAGNTSFPVSESLPEVLVSSKRVRSNIASVILSLLLPPLVTRSCCSLWEPIRGVHRGVMFNPASCRCRQRNREDHCRQHQCLTSSGHRDARQVSNCLNPSQVILCNPARPNFFFLCRPFKGAFQHFTKGHE